MTPLILLLAVPSVIGAGRHAMAPAGIRLPRPGMSAELHAALRFCCVLDDKLFALPAVLVVIAVISWLATVLT